jgi:acyl-CoA synthetase (AMP-forming)/AMP-acid ligase II
MTATTLTALMDANARAARSITYLDGERDIRQVAFGELQQRALGVLYHLQKLGARPGDKLILLLSGNEPFIDAFWGAVLGGIVPVPVAPGISDEHRMKLLRIAHKLGAPFIYTERRLLERVGAITAASSAETGMFESLQRRAFFVDDLEDVSRAGRPARVQPGDTAFIQFSSGSTSEPKGVVLTHANLIANIRGSTEIAGFNQDDVSLSWMPLTHDMGLIGFHLVMFANRVHAHLMPTDLFVRRPLLWLKFASDIRASILCSPNFGYRHYLKVLGERDPEADLSAVRLIFNGAEPISPALCDEFLTRLQPCRLRRESMFTVYGLAEASLAVSFPQPGAPFRVSYFDRHRLSVAAEIATQTADDRDALALVSVGRPIPYCQLRLADDADAVMPDGRVGHIQIRGENVTSGYFELPAVNAHAFTADGWLRTGDLGAMHDGELYITGRHKEILFIHGQNYYPHDLERIAEALPGLELGKVVAAGVRPSGAETDQLVMFVLHRGAIAEFLPLARELSRRLAEHTGLAVDAVVPVRRIPKTTSGKVQRHLLEEEYIAGAFAAELAELAQLAATAPGTAAVSDIERELQSLCESALDGRRVDPVENFFDLGISSLKLMAIHGEIERRWPGAVDITDIFDHPTLADLARRIELQAIPAR